MMQKQGSEDIPDITEQEMSSVLKDMKDNKHPGKDRLVIETINKCLPEERTPHNGKML